ncbi:hypothetical protein [Methylobacterium planeticum]|uniref:Uncharacterized protein n=1 Tax=Methylobacterium planeticum TaxID=2615211 RepID=A0A6N6MKV7_9HYPH|nr:hypothetical protein [Methylobacterium planeticum]KAB1068895.1 hypothetical protein F6X51_26185 [Methylobacterium planeticum]
MAEKLEIRWDQIYDAKVVDDSGHVQFTLNDASGNEVVVHCAYNDLPSLLSTLQNLYKEGYDRAAAKPKN